MTDYVLLISVGPVQGFISAARRSRDLWTGSWLLSEMAKASAKKLHDLNATLIFPAPAKPKEDLISGSDLSVGNKIQVVVSADSSEAVAAIAEQAIQAAKKCFLEIATQARDALKHANLRNKIWDAQIDDYVEAQAAWAKIGDGTHGFGYSHACQKAASTLAARKVTRNFSPSLLQANNTHYMLPKSSLDGMRETVLPEGDMATRTRRKLGLSDSEQLDCAGIAKRLGGEAEQFTPFTRVTAHAWIESLTDQQTHALCDAYEPLVDLELATRVRGNEGHYSKLPFDAQFCYAFRLEAAIRDNKNDAEASAALQSLQRVLRPIWQDKDHGYPCAYGVLLLADGDRMGELLDQAKDQHQHQQITRALSAFAAGVADIVRQYSGHAIYAGGDDVLAFVPLNQSYACAKKLSESFAQALKPAATALGVDEGKSPTLSVGLGIAHIMQPLGDIRALASRAEKEAKGDSVAISERRNALGIALDVRGGTVTTLRMRWDDTAAQDAFAHWLQAYTDKTIPSRVAYDTRAIHLATSFVLNQPDHTLGVKIQGAEFKRMLKKSRTVLNKELSSDMVQYLVNRGELGLSQLADELIVARWMAAKTQLDLGRDA
jgi:CRISPR-associated protein Cmr2